MTSPILRELLQHTTALRALARELVGDTRADDVVQEAAIQTLTAPPRREGPAGGWLAAVVRNLARRDRRAERTRRRHEVQAARAEVATSAPDRSVEDADTMRKLTEIVTSLPEPYRGAILARYLREQTPAEIAAATDTPVRTVKTRLQRGLVLLRQRLDEGSAEGGASDWRAMFIGAFALNQNVPPSGPMLMTTTRLALFAAVLLPMGFAIWHDARDATSEPAADLADNAIVLRGEPDTGPAPVPGSAVGQDVAGQNVAALETNNRDTRAPRGVGARREAPPLMRIDVVGPAAFRAAFSRTNIGGLLASAAGERLWRPLLAPAEHIWRQWDGRGDEFKATRQRVLDYAGRIRVFWMVQPGDADQADRVFGVFALDTDGQTDLGALAGDLTRPLLANAPAEPTDQSIGQRALRRLDDQRGDFVTIPMLIDGRVVAFFGQAGSFEESVPRCLRALANDVAPPDAPLSLHVDLGQLRNLAGAREEPAVAKLFGLASLRALRATVRPNAEFAQFDLEVEFGDGHRGLMAGILPAVASLPRLLPRVPAAATPWLLMPFRPDVMFRAGFEMAAAEDPDEGVAGLRRQMHDELGFYPDTELLDHLGGEVMVLGDLWQSDDPETYRQGDDPPLGACIAFSLKDTAAFGRGLDKLLDYVKGHVNQHEARDVDGVKITRLGSMFLTGMHVAVGQDLFAMAFGDEGVTQLEALVAGGRGAAERPLPPAIDRVRHLAPAGWNGLGLVNLCALFGGQVALAIEMLDEALPREMGFDVSVDATQEWFDNLLPLVTRHELDHLVMLAGHHAGHWRLRLLW